MDKDSGNNKGKSNKNREITTPHDKAFKEFFGKIEIAKDIIEKNLPEDILNHIDIDTLKK